MSTRGIKILLAEDNLMNQKLASAMLTKAGHKLDIAGNGKEAVQMITTRPEEYDLVFMDIHMPEVDGRKATRVLRSKGFKDLPIIAVTADAMKEDKDLSMESGMNDYITKPIKREEVFRMIKK